MIVLDASLMIAWLLQEDAAVSAPELTDILLRDEMVVPAHWGTEIGNSLLVNQRRGRIPADRLHAMLDECANLNINSEDAVPIERLGALIRLATDEGLALYDAAYLMIALERSISLGTLDQDLRRAARRLGVQVFPG